MKPISEFVYDCYYNQVTWQFAKHGMDLVALKQMEK